MCLHVWGPQGHRMSVPLERSHATAALQLPQESRGGEMQREDLCLQEVRLHEVQ